MTEFMLAFATVTVFDTVTVWGEVVSTVPSTVHTAVNGGAASLQVTSKVQVWCCANFV